MAEFAVLSNIVGSLRLCRCCKQKEKDRKKCNVAEPTVVAELSKCCVASNLPNIAEFYKKKVGSLQMLQSLQM